MAGAVICRSAEILGYQAGAVAQIGRVFALNGVLHHVDVEHVMQLVFNGPVPTSKMRMFQTTSRCFPWHGTYVVPHGVIFCLGGYFFAISLHPHDSTFIEPRPLLGDGCREQRSGQNTDNTDFFPPMGVIGKCVCLDG